MDVHLIALDEIEQQIERPLEDFQFHFIFLHSSWCWRARRLADGIPMGRKTSHAAKKPGDEGIDAAAAKFSVLSSQFSLLKFKKCDF
jgi:hypothetical protein